MTFTNMFDVNFRIEPLYDNAVYFQGNLHCIYILIIIIIKGIYIYSKTVIVCLS